MKSIRWFKALLVLILFGSIVIGVLLYKQKMPWSMSKKLQDQIDFELLANNTDYLLDSGEFYYVFVNGQIWNQDYPFVRFGFRGDWGPNNVEAVSFSGHWGWNTGYIQLDGSGFPESEFDRKTSNAKERTFFVGMYISAPEGFIRVEHYSDNPWQGMREIEVFLDELFLELRTNECSEFD